MKTPKVPSDVPVVSKCSYQRRTKHSIGVSIVGSAGRVIASVENIGLESFLRSLRVSLLCLPKNQAPSTKRQAT